MTDAMIAARMPPEKKDAGRRALERLGTNASHAINALYDYVVECKELPFPERARMAYTQEEITQAIAWSDGLAVKHASKFSNMMLKEAKQERLTARGLMNSRDTE